LFSNRLIERSLGNARSPLVSAALPLQVQDYPLLQAVEPAVQRSLASMLEAFDGFVLESPQPGQLHDVLLGVPSHRMPGEHTPGSAEQFGSMALDQPLCSLAVSAVEPPEQLSGPVCGI